MFVLFATERVNVSYFVAESTMTTTLKLNVLPLWKLAAAVVAAKLRERLHIAVLDVPNILNNAVASIFHDVRCTRVKAARKIWNIDYSYNDLARWLCRRVWQPAWCPQSAISSSQWTSTDEKYLKSAYALHHNMPFMFGTRNRLRVVRICVSVKCDVLFERNRFFDVCEECFRAVWHRARSVNAMSSFEAIESTRFFITDAKHMINLLLSGEL